ncbi:MAG: YdcF family protein [Holosporaceae bacterium]|jgi:uncharacterized SAM-binding protein YcdF (DUF218 family)|nr:YdcF family protein [Holosporaceae bacterium]
MRVIVLFVVAIIFLWLLAMSLFVFHVYNNIEIGNSRSDNVAILTGGENRIVRAIEFFRSGKPKNVFISGVYGKSTLRAVVGNDEISEVNFVLGKHAKNTRENAREINRWAMDQHMNEILVLTSDYHMPRSLYELRRINGDVKILVGAIRSKRDSKFFINCIKEFHKMVYTYFDSLLGKTVSGDN